MRASRVEHMFESMSLEGAAAGRLAGAPSAGALPTAHLRELVADLARLDRAVDDAERIDQIRALGEIKAAAAAAQARAAADLDASQRAAQADARVRAADRGGGIAAQVALARRESPVRGHQHLGLAKALVHEMPHTLQALTRGRLSEWRATLLVRETAWLSREDRRTVDELVAADTRVMEGWGDRRLVAEVRRLAYRIDAESVVRRSRRAVSERRVTCRPAPDAMAYLTALLPVQEAVAAYASPGQAADSARSAGDPRTRGQAMADALVQRVTGRAAGRPATVEVQLVMTDRSLLAGGQEAADLTGFGPVPAGWARDLVAAAASGAEALWLRRLFTAPGSGELVAMESRRRFFPAGLRRFLVARDRTCRTPWCDAPIRHADHPVPHEAGGPTSQVNGRGLCEACNQAKQAPGWRARARRTHTGHTVEVVTPTGHAYRSTAPSPPGAGPPGARTPEPGVSTQSASTGAPSRSATSLAMVAAATIRSPSSQARTRIVSPGNTTPANLAANPRTRAASASSSPSTTRRSTMPKEHSPCRIGAGKPARSAKAGSACSGLRSPQRR